MFVPSQDILLIPHIYRAAFPSRNKEGKKKNNWKN
jgi:hypothetical protein